MGDHDTCEQPQASQPVRQPEPPRRPGLPDGYRAGIIIAITAMLGFSMAFLRYWSFEAGGSWAWYSIFSTGLLGISVLLQLVSLFRALRIQDNEEPVFRVTVRCFIVSVALMVAGVLLAAVEISATAP